MPQPAAPGRQALGEVIAAMKEAAPLLAIVQERAKLHKSGGAWLGGPCPIHGGGSRTACLSVRPERGTWHCFGCQEGGDVLDWLQKANGLTFEDALEDLSRRTGIALPEKGRKQAPDGPEAKILDALSRAQDLYVATLKADPEAMAYLLATRGLSQQIIEAEGLGLAPGGWTSTLDHLSKHGVKEAIAEAAGLAVRSQKGSLIDFLRDRITVPIRDSRGRVVAFGGRIRSGDGPKYMNTKETPVYTKGRTLFGLHRAKGGLLQHGAVVVEGYFDVLALWDNGVPTALAGLGTALTEDHLRLIKRWTNRITLFFDGDDAGRKATEKALALALPMGFDVRLLTLPEGVDPDDFARSCDAPSALSGAPDWVTFKLDRARIGRDYRSAADRLAAAQEVKAWIDYLPEDRQGEVRLLVAHELRIDPRQLHTGKGRQQEPDDQQPVTRITDAMEADEAIQRLLAAMARGGAWTDWVRTIPRSWWESRKGSGYLEALLEADGDTTTLPVPVQAAIRGIQAMEATHSPIEPRRMLARLEREYLQAEIRGLTTSLAHHHHQPSLAEALQGQLQGLRQRMATVSRGAR